jgi:hypothetical protein
MLLAKRNLQEAVRHKRGVVDVLDWSCGWTDAGRIAALCSAYQNEKESSQRYRFLIHSPDQSRAMSFPAIESSRMPGLGGAIGRARLPAHGDDEGNGFMRYLTNGQHGSKTFAAVMIIVLLSVLDAYLTLDLVNRGAEELNPIMAYYLEQGPFTFFAVKYLLTWATLTVILTLKETHFLGSKIQGKSLLWLFMIALALVVQWELVMIHSSFD